MSETREPTWRVGISGEEEAKYHPGKVEKVCVWRGGELLEHKRKVKVGNKEQYLLSFSKEEISLN